MPPAKKNKRSRKVIKPVEKKTPKIAEELPSPKEMREPAPEQEISVEDIELPDDMFPEEDDVQEELQSAPQDTPQDTPQAPAAQTEPVAEASAAEEEVEEIDIVVVLAEFSERISALEAFADNVQTYLENIVESIKVLDRQDVIVDKRVADCAAELTRYKEANDEAVRTIATTLEDAINAIPYIAKRVVDGEIVFEEEEVSE